MVLDYGALFPDVHYDQEDQGDHDGNVAADHELAAACDEEHDLDEAEDDTHKGSGEYFALDLDQIYHQEQCGHQHGDGDGQTVGVLDAAGCTEVEDYQAAAYPHDGVHQGYVKLTLLVRGISDLHVGQKIQVDGFRHQGEGACDQRLRCDDGCHRTYEYRYRSHSGGEHLEKWIKAFAIHEGLVVHIPEDPCALSAVIEQQAELDEGPAHVDALLAYVTHVGIEGLSAGSGEEY